MIGYKGRIYFNIRGKGVIMAKYEARITGQLQEVISNLHNDIMNSALSMNLVDESNYTAGEIQVAVRVYDKYFMRNESRASLSLTAVAQGSDIFISAIGAGGGKGVFLNFTFGAEESIVDIVRESIAGMGY